jgi:hypothetical protein
MPARARLAFVPLARFALLLPAAPSCAAHHGAYVPLAGAYTWGVNGSNDCPAPSSRIVDAPACQRAAAAAGKTYNGEAVADPTFPRGCAWYTSDNSTVRLNTAVGAGSASAVLLCALGSAPAGVLPCALR